MLEFFPHFLKGFVIHGRQLIYRQYQTVVVFRLQLHISFTKVSLLQFLRSVADKRFVAENRFWDRHFSFVPDAMERGTRCLSSVVGDSISRVLDASFCQFPAASAVPDFTIKTLHEVLLETLVPPNVMRRRSLPAKEFGSLIDERFFIL